MRTKELARHLRPMRPCTIGLRRLLRYDTVAQWWEQCSAGDDLCFLWIFIATADDDDVFARELSSLELLYHFDDTGLLRSIHRFRRGAPWVQGYIRSAQCSDANFVRSTLRRPTDREIRNASKWWKVRERERAEWIAERDMLD